MDTLCKNWRSRHFPGKVPEDLRPQGALPRLSRPAGSQGRPLHPSNNWRAPSHRPACAPRADAGRHPLPRADWRARGPTLTCVSSVSPGAGAWAWEGDPRPALPGAWGGRCSLAAQLPLRSEGRCAGRLFRCGGRGREAGVLTARRRGATSGGRSRSQAVPRPRPQQKGGRVARSSRLLVPRPRPSLL